MRHAVMTLFAVAAILLSSSLAYPAEEPAPCSLTVHFVPRCQFSEYIPSAVPGNVGYFVTYWNDKDEIVSAIALIASDADQAERVHCIREEITQALGPMRDSFKYPDSIFYQPWSLVSHFSGMDKALIRTLYGPSIRPGMNAAQVRRALKHICPPALINYVVEIACGAEYAESDELVHKWMHSPTLQIEGQLYAHRHPNGKACGR